MIINRLSFHWCRTARLIWGDRNTNRISRKVLDHPLRKLGSRLYWIAKRTSFLSIARGYPGCVCFHSLVAVPNILEPLRLYIRVYFICVLDWLYCAAEKMFLVKTCLKASIVLTVLSFCWLLPHWKVTSTHLSKIQGLGKGVWTWANGNGVPKDGNQLVVFGDSWADNSVEDGRGRSWTDLLCDEVHILLSSSIPDKP